MRFYVRNDINSDYYEKKRSKPYIPSSVEPKSLDQYWDIWATYVIEKVECVNDELVLYAIRTKTLSYPRACSEYVSIEDLISGKKIDPMGIVMGYTMK